MTLHLRLRIDAKCRLHPRYDPERDGQPASKDCPGCESLHVIALYAGIARNKAENGEGLFRQIKSSSQPSTDQNQPSHLEKATTLLPNDEDREMS